MLNLRPILSLLVISVVCCNLTENLNGTGSFSVKAETTKALEKLVETLPNKTSTRSRQEILSPEYDWESGDKDDDLDDMKDWILCQKVNWKLTKELCKNCQVCNNVIPVKTGFNVVKNETFVIGVDGDGDDNDDDYDYLNLNINKKRRVIKSQFRPRPKPRPKPIRRGHKRDPKFKKAASTPSGLVTDNSAMENNQKKRETQTMAILKNAFHEKRISLKEYLIMLNSLVFLSNKPMLRVSGPLTSNTSFDDFDSDIKDLNRNVVKDNSYPDTNDNDNESVI